MGKRIETAGDTALSRSEIELELGRLALGIGRLHALQQQQRRRGVALAEPGAVEVFIAASTELVHRAPVDIRPALVERLCALSSSAGLGIIGLEEWFEADRAVEQLPDRHVAVNVTWDGEGGSTSSGGRL